MHDLIAELERARRRVGAEPLEDTTAHSVELRRTLRAPVEDVWDACTNPERVRRWFLPLSGDLRLGGRFQLEGNAGGEIVACEPPRRLEVSWVFGDSGASLVTLELAAAGDAETELTLRHAVPEDDHWAQYGPGAVGVGWDMALLSLSIHAAGEELPDLMADPAMPAFMRDSAARWGTAHAASGADPEQARDAAARTRAAYAPDDAA